MAGLKFEGRVDVRVKPGARRTEITGQDPLTISLKAPAEDNKANIELIKFLSRLSKKQVRIVVGLTSKRKVVEFF